MTTTTEAPADTGVRGPISLEQMIERAKVICESYMNNDGACPALVIGQLPTGQPLGCLMEVPKRNPDKDALIRDVRKLFELKGVVSFAMIHEAWMADVGKAGPNGQPDLSVPPSEHPNRVEIVQVIASDGARNLGTMAKIKRNPDNSFAGLDEWTTVPGAQLTGRFFDLLPRKTIH